MKLFNWAKRSRDEPVSQEDLARLLTGEDSWSGIEVNRQSALGISAVWACVRVLSETLASLPIFLYHRIDGGKEKAYGHPLYDLLHIKPNGEQSAFQYKEVCQGHLSLQGNTYSNIVRNNTGYVKELWPLNPERIRDIKRVSGKLVYVYKDGTTEVEIPREEMLHISGLGYDGIRGYSPLEMEKQSFGSAIATRRYGAEFFKNGGAPGGYLKTDKRLTEEAVKKLKASWDSKHTDWGNKHKIGILEEGMEYTAVSIPPEHAQFIETFKLSVTDIARIFRVPPHLIADLDRSTNNNIEHQGIEFVVYTMRPWLVRWEQAITLQLIPEREQKDYFAEFQVDALLRGDVLTRSQAYRTFREMGVYSANEIRAFENMNPIEDGDEYFVPMNWVPASMAGEIQAPVVPAQEEPEEEPEENNRMSRSVEVRARKAASSRHVLANSFRGLFANAAQRIIRKERRDITQGIKKYLTSRGQSEFDIWLEEYYRELPEYIISQVSPTYRTFMSQVKAGIADELGVGNEITAEDEDFVRAYVSSFARRWIGKSKADIRAAITKGVDSNIDPDIMLDSMFDHWEDGRGDEVGHNEAVRGSNAFAKTMYVLAGVTSLRWIAVGAKTCPYCSSLDGSTIEINNDFALPGDQLIENDNPLNVQHNVGHPPLHRGCDCQIVAG